MHSLQTLIAHVADAELIGAANTDIHGVAYDSRKVGPGDLFVAIRGTHTDGHRYIDAAVERGAAALVADRRYWELRSFSNAQGDHLPVVLTANSLAALAPIAAAFY